LTNNLKQTYEAMFLVDAAVATSNWEGVVDTINKMMDRVKAEVISLRKWDELRLCYDVKGCKRGTYILIYFSAKPDVIGDLERQVQLDETLLRVLILSAERIPQGQMEVPTPAMLQETREQPVQHEENTPEKAPIVNEEELDSTVADITADPANLDEIADKTENSVDLTESSTDELTGADETKP
jgi:small subunit ribosomal protein S6